MSVDTCGIIEMSRAEDSALVGTNLSADPEVGSKSGAGTAGPGCSSAPGQLAFNTNAKNPRGSGGQSPPVQENCL